MRRCHLAFLLLLLLLLAGCNTKPSGHDQMVKYLADLHKRNEVADNFFSPAAKVRFYDSLLLVPDPNPQTRFSNRYLRAYFLLQNGEVEEAISVYETLIKEFSESKTGLNQLKANLAVAYLRLGDQANCWTPDGSSSCILPIQGDGIHKEDLGARKAIALYKEILTDNPDDLESRWLLNIAYVVIGEYPHNVPAKLLIPGMNEIRSAGMKPFREIAADLGVNTHSMSGGSILEDFDRDGFLDIVTSSWSLAESMNYFRNNGDGTFSDRTVSSGLDSFTGGLNIMQTDYNNDRYPDIFVLRGAWMGKFGLQPNSLLKNNGDGTFTDVTIESNLFSLHPTQTATWNDFNNDGWLDVFIGNESTDFPHPCELYINQKDGTFKNEARIANVGIIDFVKGVTASDYDNDGWTDIFISTMNRRSYLLKNKGKNENGNIVFEDVSQTSGVSRHGSKTFPTWFWDYNNDGNPDIFLCAYEFQKSLGYYEARELLNLPNDTTSMMKLFHNNGDGTFTNVADRIGLNKVVNAMGANFADVDNDGYLDICLGTGNPDSKSVVPNKFFRNDAATMFVDATSESRLGHLQKGHGVSFADIDHDGDVDIHMQVGGSFKGDAFQNSLYENPGYGKPWIAVELRGVKSNSFGIGSKIKITYREADEVKTVWRQVGSGGSFGSSPFRCHVGLNNAQQIESIEVRWSGSGTVQKITGAVLNKMIVITEGKDNFETIDQVRFSLRSKPR